MKRQTEIKIHLAVMAICITLLIVFAAVCSEANAEEHQAAIHQQKLDHLLGLLGRGQFDYQNTHSYRTEL